MKFTTLERMHRLMVEEVNAREKACEMARTEANKAADDVDYALSNEMSEEYIEETKKQSSFKRDMYNKLWRELSAAREALEDFENHDFN